MQIVYWFSLVKKKSCLPKFMDLFVKQKLWILCGPAHLALAAQAEEAQKASSSLSDLGSAFHTRKFVGAARLCNRRRPPQVPNCVYTSQQSRSVALASSSPFSRAGTRWASFKPYLIYFRRGLHARWCAASGKPHMCSSCIRPLRSVARWWITSGSC